LPGAVAWPLAAPATASSMAWVLASQSPRQSPIGGQRRSLTTTTSHKYSRWKLRECPCFRAQSAFLRKYKAFACRLPPSPLKNRRSRIRLSQKRLRERLCLTQTTVSIVSHSAPGRPPPRLPGRCRRECGDSGRIGKSLSLTAGTLTCYRPLVQAFVNAIKYIDCHGIPEPLFLSFDKAIKAMFPALPTPEPFFPLLRALCAPIFSLPPFRTTTYVSPGPPPLPRPP